MLEAVQISCLVSSKGEWRPGSLLVLIIEPELIARRRGSQLSTHFLPATLLLCDFLKEKQSHSYFPVSFCPSL